MQLVFQHKEKLKVYKPPDIIPTEDGLEELLKYLRKLSIDEFE